MRSMVTSAGPPVSLASLTAGVAVVDAITPLVAGHELGIHWPNDVILDTRKLAGILIEVLPDGKQVIGIGINVNNTAADAPAEVRPRVATLRDAIGQSHDATDLLIVILKHLERQFAELARSPQRIVARTNELCLQRGKRLEVIQGTRRVEGLCGGIAADGALVIETDDRVKTQIYSGTITTA
jgi:BirA family biotin operon repressor/biotin-[acetyl-CoA-carboxylase] ligase